MKLKILHEDPYVKHFDIKTFSILDNESGIEYAHGTKDYNEELDKVVMSVIFDQEFYILPEEAKLDVIETIAAGGRGIMNILIANEDADDKADARRIMEISGLFINNADGTWKTMRTVRASGDRQADIEKELNNPLQKSKVLSKRGAVRSSLGDDELPIEKLKDSRNLMALDTAIDHHSRIMNGKRWPALEQNIVDNLHRRLQRSNTDAVIALFKYLTRLREPWKAGENYAKNLVRSMFRKQTKRYELELERNEGDEDLTMDSMGYLGIHRDTPYLVIIKEPAFEEYVRSRFNLNVYLVITWQIP